MHLKVFVKLKKTLKILSPGQKNPKKTQKNPKKPQKTQKKPTGLGFFKKTRVFSNPGQIPLNAVYNIPWSHNLGPVLDYPYLRTYRAFFTF